MSVLGVHRGAAGCLLSGVPIKVMIVEEVSAAVLSALLVSPAVTVIDQAIISNASGKLELVQSIKQSVHTLVTRPTHFIAQPAFRWIWTLYSLTYITANLADHIPGQHKEAYKFISTSAVNMSVCVAKDRAFARMFGVIAPTKLPNISYALFASRDLMTILASFTLPQHVANIIPLQDPNNARNLAQLITPMTVQLVSTPIHLLGLDFYNRKNQSYTSRFNFIKREYLKSTAARLARIAPAFGIGGIANRYFRDTFKGENGSKK
jgi:hypothetical protein